MSLGCRIKRNFERPAKELIEAFRGIPVANIDDNMGRIGAVDSSIYPLNPNAKLLGTAFTVNAPAGDNLLFHASLDMAQPGDVLVVDGNGCTSRSLMGEINVPVSCGGQVVFPGDILVGDADGVCVIRKEEARGLVEAVQKKYYGEEMKLQQYHTVGNDTETHQATYAKIREQLKTEIID